jgi:dTDP-4-dehydrorhamnose 3,5-epimerase
MKFTALCIPDVILVEPRVFEDSRGFFYESYNLQRFRENGISTEFVQDNHSRSARGVLRGLHFQKEPHAQGKLVRAVKGAIFDVAVDIRPGSPTYGCWVGEQLDSENRRMLYIPAGFAHGFCSLADNTEVLYKATDFYSAPDESGLIWNDPEVKITWPDLGMPFVLSSKDLINPRLKDLGAC